MCVCVCGGGGCGYSSPCSAGLVTAPLTKQEIYKINSELLHEELYGKQSK